MGLITTINPISSMFDSEVYQARKDNPFADISLLRFICHAVDNCTDENNVATLTCQYRHSVASRRWWTLSWLEMKADGTAEAKEVSAQEYQLCLWRAQQVHKICERRRELEQHVSKGRFFSDPLRGWVDGDGI
jgi:hypothetical protein